MNSLESYEGKFNFLYLDSNGYVTVGVGHLLASKSAMSEVTMYKTKNGIPMEAASLAEKHNEYEVIKAKGQNNYTADHYKKFTTLIMKDDEISSLLGKHVDIFYGNLTDVYKKIKGYADDFDNFPKEVQSALFDMIFNLGRSGLVNKFLNFNKAMKEGDWKAAAENSNRTGISSGRNS